MIVVSEKLYAPRSAINPNTHIIPHGVDFDLFSRALDPLCEIPEEIGTLTRPVIGFYGNIYDWVDQDLIAAIARLRPAWSLVMIGKILADVTALRSCANIHLLGPRSHENLPRYCKGFDVGIIPYSLQDPRMQSVNPLKLREFLAAGVPVISVDMKEVRTLRNQADFFADVAIASNVEEFVVEIEKFLAADTSELRRQRSLKMQHETWADRVSTVEQLVSAIPDRPSAVSRVVSVCL